MAERDDNIETGSWGTNNKKISKRNADVSKESTRFKFVLM